MSEPEVTVIEEKDQPLMIFGRSGKPEDVIGKMVIKKLSDYSVEAKIELNDRWKYMLDVGEFVLTYYPKPGVSFDPAKHITTDLGNSL